MSASGDLVLAAEDVIEVTTAGSDIDVQALTSISGPGTLIVRDPCARLDLLLASSSGNTRTLTDLATEQLPFLVTKILAATTVGVRIWICKS